MQDSICDWIMAISTSIYGLGTMLLAFAAMKTAKYAAIGVKEWKRQLRGKDDYSLAKRVLLGVNKIRAALNRYRVQESDGDYIFDRKDSKMIIRDAIAEFDEVVLDVEILWGVDARNLIEKDLGRLIMRTALFDDAPPLLPGVEDDFTQEMNRTISRIEDYVRPHLVADKDE